MKHSNEQSLTLIPDVDEASPMIQGPKRLTSTLACACLSLVMLGSPAMADTIFGIYAGVGSWNSDFDGDIASLGSNIDLSTDLAFDRESQNFIYVALEHPIPLLPNIKVARTALEGESTTVLNSTLSFEGSTFSTGESVQSTLDLSHTDFVGYYEVLDNWISLDLGLNIRNFSGEARLSGSTVAESDLSAWVPLGYAKAQFDLPFSGFYLGADVNALSFDDNEIADITVRVGYESILGFGAELGYRKLTLELSDVEDDSFQSDLDTDGAYLALTLHI